MQGRRKQKQTVLIYCGNLHDLIFMEHLKKMYGPQSPSVSFKIKSGTGKSPLRTVLGAKKVLGDYDIRIAKIDNDKGIRALADVFAMKKDIRISYCTPAIEATMLEILEPEENYRNHSTQHCKDRLHGIYITEKDRTNPSKYDELFSYDTLEIARYKHSRLNHMIQIFEQGTDWEESKKSGDTL